VLGLVTSFTHTFSPRLGALGRGRPKTPTTSIANWSHWSMIMIPEGAKGIHTAQSLIYSASIAVLRC